MIKLEANITRLRATNEPSSNRLGFLFRYYPLSKCFQALVVLLLLTGIAYADEIDSIPAPLVGDVLQELAIEEYKKSVVDIDDLVPAIIQVESGGNPFAVSRAGCVGLMQINPKGALAEWNKCMSNNRREVRNFEITFNFANPTIKRQKELDIEYPDYNIGDMYDPSKNVEVGTFYLNRLKNHYLKYHYTLETLLASYNWGISNVRKVNYQYSRFPNSVKNYIRKVKKVLNDL